jgi:hypothetical protein
MIIEDLEKVKSESVFNCFSRTVNGAKINASHI